MLRRMPEPVEQASFRSDDQPCLVRAALACRRCLSGAVDWSLVLRDWDSEVECTCRDCGHSRVIALNPAQALRLHLHRNAPLPA